MNSDSDREEDPYGELDTDIDEYDLDEEDLKSFSRAQEPVVLELPKESCCVICNHYTQGFGVIKEDPSTYHKRSLKCLLLSLSEKSVECQINSVRNSMLTALYLKMNELIEIEASMHFADDFLRVRHELLFQRMCKAMDIPFDKSDMKFSDVLPITSERTPDWIKVDMNNVNILEVTVTTNLDKAAKSKGIESMGYQSKYRKEINELKALGYNVSYHVVVFNSLDLADLSYRLTIKELCETYNTGYNNIEGSYLESLRKEFCKLSRLFYSNFSDCLSKLFNKSLTIKNDLSSHVKQILGMPKRSFQGKYKLINISPILFDTIIRNWNRLVRILEFFYDEDDLNLKSIPIYDHATSKFNFRKFEAGLTFDEWMSCLINDNKALFCRYLKIFYKTEEIRDRKPGFEFFYYEEEENDEKISVLNMREGSDPIVYNHQNSSIILDVSDISCKHDYSCAEDIVTLASKYEDHKYEEKMIACYKNLMSSWSGEVEMQSWSKSTGLELLGFKRLDTKMVSKAVELYKQKLYEMNSETLSKNISIPYCKAATIFPINVTYPDSYGEVMAKPTILEELVKFRNIGDYTSKILLISSSNTFNWGSRPKDADPDIERVKKEIRDLQGNSLSLQKDAARKANVATLPKLRDIEGGKEIAQELSFLYKRFRDLKKIKGGDKQMSVIRLKTSGGALLKSSFKEEMNHFKRKDQRAYYKGVGNGLDFDVIKRNFKDLCDYMLAPAATKCMDEIYSEHVAEDVPILMKLKEDYMKAYKPYYDWLKSTNMYHACAFISRLCHTLLFYSQSSLNSSYVALDNLGYTDCILICKGGKKIFPTKRSKLFRVFYPISEPYKNLMFPPGFDCSSTLINIKNRSYLISPWQMWHETHLTDGLCYLNKLMGFCLLSQVPERSHFKNANSCLFNIILAFHARRQTESMLHNLRYIMVNCLGDLTAIDDMLPEFAGFNYDCIQFYIRNCVAENFLNYFEKCKLLVAKVLKEGWSNAIEGMNLPHIFTDIELSSSDDFARSIYSTYLMPKAPITQSLEQVSNLKGMLETHSVFLKESTNDLVKREDINYVTLNQTTNHNDYVSKLFESDFNFDPSYMVLLGKMMSDYLSDKFNKSEMSVVWDKIISQSWDRMSNSSGLRGEGDGFFGRKGYYVVYDDILKSGKITELMKELNKEVIDEKVITRLNETFADKIKKESLNQIIFHVVDKVQRGGKREIFVMDKMTKVHQQPIEQFVSEISKRCPGEMISIPSNKRLHTIHSKVFESKHDSTNQAYYWVMDCRKWAPRSMLEKFIFFLSGMREILPPTFLKHCYNFFMMMLNKEVHTRPHIVEIMRKSEGNKWVDYNWMLSDESKKSCYYKMSYSWMMGIFNYLSSLIHVANQLHATHLIQKINMEINSDFVTLTPIAHSDDSAAKFSSPNLICTQKSISIYEIMLKSANHMLSKKKCNVGKVYFEFISILYLGTQLLPLLPKFLGQFNFQPTDGGYCTDINDSYSKCINLIQNGATFQQAYMSTKIQSDLIWRFYFGKNRVKNYNLPTQLYGSIDAHPLVILLSGSDADILRLFVTKGEHYLNKLSYINEYLNPSKSLGVTLFQPITASPDIRPNSLIRKHIEQIPEEALNEVDWSLTNVNFQNTAFNCLQYLLKLKNKSFCASMQDDTLTRRISRSYFFRESTVIKTNLGMLKQSDLITLINVAANDDTLHMLEALGYPDPEDVSIKLENEFKTSKKFSNIVSLIYSELLRLMHYWSKMSYSSENLYHQKKTTKPIHISLQKTIESINVKFDPSMLTSWVKEPKYRNLLPNTVGYSYAQVELETLLSDFGLKIDDVDSSSLFHILGRVKSKSFSNIYCYGNVPSGLREINTYQDITLYLAHNSFEDKYIKGLTLPLGRTINNAAQNIMPELRLDEVQHTCALLNVIISCNCTMSSEAFKDFTMLDLRVPDYLENHVMGLDKGFKIGDAPSMLQTFWVKDKRVYSYFKSMLEISLSMVNNKVIDAEVFTDSFHYCFLKRQFLVVDTWMGRGKLLISMGKVKVVLDLDGSKVNSMIVTSTEMELDKTQLNYLNFVLHSCELRMLNEHMIDVTSDMLDKIRFGVGHDGVYKTAIARMLIKCIPNIQIEPNLATKLTNLGLFKVSMRKRMKVELKSYNEIFGDSKFVLNLFIVDPEKSLEVSKGMLDKTRNNELILTRWNKDERAYLLDIMSQCLDIDLYVNHSEVYNHYEYTKLYKIMNYMQTRDLYSITSNKLRQNVYPAQEGGMLDLLIRYQMETGDIDFNWNRIVTPELMHMKSTQPEAFMSNLFTNLKDKYESLYEKEDKEQIFRELDSIKMTAGCGDDKKLLNLLMMWGFVGVSGSISELSKKQLAANFQIFRDYPNDFKLIGEFSNCFIEFVGALFSCYIENFNEVGETFTPMCGKSYYKHTSEDIKENLISIVTNITCFLYQGGKSRHLYLTAADVFIYEILLSITKNEKLVEFMLDKLSNNYLLSQIPIKPENIIDIFRLYRSLFMCFIQVNKIDEKIVNNNKMNRINILLPSVRARDLAVQLGVGFNVRKVFYNGFIPVKLYDRLNRSYQKTKGDKNLRVALKVIDYSDISNVKFHPKFSFKGRLSEDFMSSDEFEEINFEFETMDPDIDNIEEQMESFDGDIYREDKIMRIAINNKLTEHYKIPVLNYLGLNNDMSYCDKYLQAGNDVVVITNSLYIPLLMSEVKFNIFQFKRRNWHDKSLINPEHIFAIVVSKNIKDVTFWCEILDADLMEKNWISEVVYNFKLTTGRTKDNKIVDDYNSIYGEPKDNDAILGRQMMWKSDEVLEDNEDDKNDDDIDELPDEDEDELERILVAGGIEIDIAKKYRSIAMEAKSEGKNIYSIFSSLFKNILKNKKAFDRILSKQHNIINSPLTEDQVVKIFQVPSIFGQKISRDSNIKNNALKEKELIAEIDSLTGGQTSKMVSGLLTITPKMYNRAKTCVSMCRKLVKITQKDKDKKTFLLDFFTLFLNDAKLTTDSPSNENWADAISIMNTYIDWDDDEVEGDLNIYKPEPEKTGRVGYKLYGERDA